MLEIVLCVRSTNHGSRYMINAMLDNAARFDIAESEEEAEQKQPTQIHRTNTTHNTIIWNSFEILIQLISFTKWMRMKWPRKDNVCADQMYTHFLIADCCRLPVKYDTHTVLPARRRCLCKFCCDNLRENEKWAFHFGLLGNVVGCGSGFCCCAQLLSTILLLLFVIFRRGIPLNTDF